MRRSAAVMAVVIGAALALVLGAVAVGPAGPADAAGTGSTRYLDPIFPTVDVTRDVVYGQARNTDGVVQDLTLDVYQPRGDTSTARPLVIWVHGGSFITGDKSSMAVHAEYLAQRGYVTASINYRLRPDATWSGTSISDVLGDSEFLISVYQAYADALTSVAWFRAHAAEYGIDTDRVAVGGYSAGAVTALNATFLPQRANGQGLPDDPTSVRAAISLAGTTTDGIVEIGEGPVFMAHGTRDTTVYYDQGAHLCDTANARYDPCEFHSYDASHNLSPFWPDIQARYADFLYRWVIQPIPRLEQISPGTGPTTGGATLTITGSGFTGATSVTFGGLAAPSFTVDSDHRLTVTTPAQAPTFEHVRVRNANGLSTTSTRTLFTVVAPPSPQVVRLAPNHGPVAGGTSVVITGSGFTGATGVRFGAVAAPTFTVDSDTQITAVTPAVGPYLVNVFVDGPGGTSPGVTYRTWFRFETSPPAVSAVQPNSGPAAGGTSVVITGSGFTGATRVRFGSAPAASFTVESDTRITATTPPGSSIQNVFVDTPGGSSPIVPYRTWFVFQ